MNTAIIITLSVLPLALYLLFYAEDQNPQTKRILNTQEITLPTPDPNNPKEGQCAICMQITDAEPKEQCLQNFGCNY